MLLNRIITSYKLISHCNHSSVGPRIHVQHAPGVRLLTEEHKKHTDSYKDKKEKLGTYVIQKFSDYLKNYVNVLEKRFPTAMKMYRVVSIGTKEFLGDFKSYISLRIKFNKYKNFNSMTRRDIELYEKMPSDIWRMAPVFILGAIPFGNYLIFPLAFYKPRTLLCSHFWSIQQKSEFSILDLKDRLKNNRPVYRSLQSKMHSIPDGTLKIKWSQVIALLGSGNHPLAHDVLTCKELFCKEPYSLDHLSYSHMGHLLKMYGLRKGIFRKKKLKYKAFLLHEMDKAIVREGGVKSINTESLRHVCHLRGLNGSHLSNQDMRDWLQQWINISQKVDSKSFSMLLHCPILLAYNHPQNWVLIYS